MNWNSPTVVSISSQGLDPNELRKLYWDEELSTYGIAERLEISLAIIRKIMRESNIPRRSLREAAAVRFGRILTVEERNGTHHHCPGCNELKPIEEFSRNNANYGGLGGYCKQCYRERTLKTGGERYTDLCKRPFPLNGKCELCSIELNPQYYCSHHWDDANLNLTISVCSACDFLAEGLDEIEKNPWKVDIYHRLKKKVEEVEKKYVRLGPFKPPNGIRRLYSSIGILTHKWCEFCNNMKSVKEFNKNHSSEDGLDYKCRKCRQSSRLHSSNGRFTDLHKRPRPAICELCGDSPKKLDYHHWDDKNRSKGVYVCGTHSKKRCHQLVEAVDLLDTDSSLPNKYYKLRQSIIGQEANKVLLEAV